MKKTPSKRLVPRPGTRRGKTRPRSAAAPAVRRGSRAEQYAAGRALREQCPRKSRAAWRASSKRRDVVEMVLAAEKGRLPDLLPLRHGRMVRSAFTFYRGSALPMAADLASTPATGVRIQICGDAHLCNFGGFATPERRVIFSINDLDETHPAPWEWDVKRLAASFVIASLDNGLGGDVARDAAKTCVCSYRESMAEFSEMQTLELWYYSLEAETLIGNIKDPDFRRRAINRLQKERGKSVAEDLFPKLVDHEEEMPLIKDQLPTIFHAEGRPPGEIQQVVRAALVAYRGTLPSSTQSVLDRYELCDAAMKVVGIGSVGTSCWVVLFMAGEGDPLFLQVKEARASVLEPYTSPSTFAKHGERVVNGYRIMQPASDLFLGWSWSPTRDFFVRQLRDIKISVRVEAFGSMEMDLYATWCGRALALSHARSGASILLSGYMGKSDAFDEALADFAVQYAGQNEKDHEALARAVKRGKVKAVFEEEK